VLQITPIVAATGCNKRHLVATSLYVHPYARLLSLLATGRILWLALADGLPEPLPAMPDALLAVDGRVFAGLADRQIWESIGRGDSWRACTIRGEPLTALHALAYANI
jgi:hypothetical protein